MLHIYNGLPGEEGLKNILPSLRPSIVAQGERGLCFGEGVIEDRVFSPSILVIVYIMEGGGF